MAGNAAKQRNSSAAPNRLLQVLTIFIGVSSSTFTNPWGASRQSRAENGDRPVGQLRSGMAIQDACQTLQCRKKGTKRVLKTAIWWPTPSYCLVIERKNAQFAGNYRAASLAIARKSTSVSAAK